MKIRNRQDRWFNYKKQCWEDRGFPASDDEAKELISQSGPAQNLYDLCRDQGMSIAEAMKEVLEAQLPPK